ncbi:MAG: dTDP-glucose 4,6-dehydratase [Planctomycetota bacterium]|nr:MAG: dTDP-glucose 4,6-dehydratase [Planctomycetota bacterium]
MNAAPERPLSRLLITGGAGFLGTHLARAALQQGHAVTLLDDLSAPSTLALPAHPRLRCVIGDVRSPAVVEQAAHDAEQIVHMASVVGVDAVLAEPERTGSVIREGTARVWNQALASRTPLVFLSSSEVTDAARHGPRAIYAQAKLDAERSLLGHAQAELVTVLRPFNVVGPGQTAPGMVLPSLARAALAGEPLRLHGDGSQQRGFLHVRDFCDTVLALLALPEARAGQVLEIGSPARVSIAELAERLLRLAGSRAGIVCAPSPRPREDLPRRAPQLEALQALLPFAPQRELDTILREVLHELKPAAAPAPAAASATSHEDASPAAPVASYVRA